MVRWLLVIGILSAVFRTASGASYCLDYGIVSLTGTVVRQVYAGPPDYESVTKGDEPQTIWILQLDRSVCVEAVSGSTRLYNEREVQLEVTPDNVTQYRALLGQKIIATGRLLPGGARHDKRLVLAPDEIKKTGVLP
jgi:hypothetical protein